MKHKIASSMSMSMGEPNFLLRTKRIEVKETRVVPTKSPSILKLDNLSLGIYSIYYNMMCLRSLT